MGDETTDSCTIEFCHEQLDEARQCQVADFLQAGGALPEAESAATRASQTVALAFSKDGELIGQLSAEPRRVEQLDNRFWVLAVYVDPQHRGGDLARRLTRVARERLEANFRSGHNPDIIGLFMVLQTRAFKTGRDLAVTPLGNIFIGRNRRGDNMRVYYFEGACIDGSAPDLEHDPQRAVLGAGYRLEIVWDQMDDELVSRVSMFLYTAGAIKDLARAHERARQTVVLAYDADGNIAGQHCVERQYIPQVLNDLWTVSIFVGKDHRRAHLSRHLNLLGQAHLQEQYLKGSDTDVIGIYYRMQSPRYKASDQRAISFYSGLVFIGRNRRGENLRVYYFPGAHIDRAERNTDLQN